MLFWAWAAILLLIINAIASLAPPVLLKRPVLQLITPDGTAEDPSLYDGQIDKVRAAGLKVLPLCGWHNYIAPQLMIY